MGNVATFPEPVIVKTGSHNESPSALFVWQTWHSAASLGVIGAAVVCVVMLFGGMQQSANRAQQAERDRLFAVGKSLIMSGAGSIAGDASAKLTPELLDEIVATVPGFISAQIMQSPAAPGAAGPDRVVASVPIGTGEGFLILESRSPSGVGLPAMLLPVGISACVIGGLGVLAHRFAGRTTGIRRVASALAAIDRGETDRELLMISEAFGTEATVWNRVIRPHDRAEPLANLNDDDRREAAHVPNGDISTSTLDALSVGIVGLDRMGRMLFCNGAAATMLGVDRRAILSESYETVGALADAIETIRAVVEGDSRRATLELTRGDSGNQHTLRIGVRGLRKSDGAHVLMMIDDVTQQRLADAARDSFVAQATHELRTPLTNIRLAAEEAIDAGATDPAGVSMALNIVNTEARRLERVVSDMLSVSEMEAATMSLKIDDVSLSVLLEHIETDYRNQAAEHAIEFTVNKPAKLEGVFGDREKISQLLHNIVGNAIKYTPDGGAVTITATQSPTDWQVEVRDTGLGIGPDEQDRVFEKFYRASSAKSSEVVGSGLGLAMAAEIARLHGGEITLESELGVGSTFTVRIPRGHQAAGAKAA